MRISLSSKAFSFLRKAERTVFERILAELIELGTNPLPKKAKIVVGKREKIFRVRTGDYRILYVVFLEEETILVVNIDKRSKAYR